MNKLIDRQVVSSAHHQVPSDDHPARSPESSANEIAAHSTKPTLRSATIPSATLVAPDYIQNAHAPHSQKSPQWQSPKTAEPVESKTTASSYSGVQPPCRRRHEIVKAADGTEASPEVRSRLQLLIDALKSKSATSFKRAVEGFDLGSLAAELKYLDGAILENLIRTGSVAIVRQFLFYFKGESIKFINGPKRGGRFDALGAAAAKQDVEMGLLLFDAGARPEDANVHQTFWNALLKNAVAKNRLRSAEALTLYGDPELVRNLPKLPAHNYPDKSRDELDPSKAIIFHMRKGNQKQLTSIFSIMFDRAGPDGASRMFDEFLLLAIDENKLEILKLLIAAKPGELKSLKPSRSLEHLMYDMARDGNADVLEILLDYHPLIRPKREDEWMFSGFRNYFDDNLSFSGRTINKEDQDGNTLLHLAAHSGSAATMALLLDRGADGRKILEQALRKLPSPARTGPRSSKSVPTWTLDYLLMKSAMRGMENNNAPWIVQPALSRIANDVTALEAALSGRIGGPTAAQSAMVKAGILAQSNPPSFLAGANPYQDPRLDIATAGELNRHLAAWSLGRAAEGEALEAPLGELITELWEFINRRNLNDAQVGKSLKADLIDHGMYGLIADCVVAAFTAASSHGAQYASEEGRQKSFADALKREIWLNPAGSRQRDEAARASANPVLFDMLMHRQLYVVEQYCQHHLASAGAPLASQ